MTPQQANEALSFLERTPLRGEEAPQFLTVVQALRAVASGAVVVTDPATSEADGPPA